MTGFRNVAQDRADEIKARRSVEAREAAAEDTFDIRPVVLTVVAGPVCGHHQGRYVCRMPEHSAAIGHYFTRERTTP